MFELGARPVTPTAAAAITAAFVDSDDEAGDEPGVHLLANRPAREYLEVLDGITTGVARLLQRIEAATPDAVTADTVDWFVDDIVTPVCSDPRRTAVIRDYVTDIAADIDPIRTARPDALPDVLELSVAAAETLTILVLLYQTVFGIAATDAAALAAGLRDFEPGAGITWRT